MASWTQKDLTKILNATGEDMKPEYLEARLSLVEDNFNDFKDMFKKHIEAEETKDKEIFTTLRALTEELHETNAIIREQGIVGRSELKECSFSLKEQVLKEVDAELDKIDKQNKQFITELTNTFHTRQSDLGKRVGDAENKLISILDSHELLKKIQMTVAIAVVAAILKLVGLY
jgi:hypothetical protein